MGHASRKKRGKNTVVIYSAENVRAVEERVTREFLGEKGLNLEGVLAAAHRSQRQALYLAQNLPTDGPLACTSGCDWCCHLAVSACPHEVFLAADWIRKHLPAAQIDEILRRARAVIEETKGLPWKQRTLRVIPCPLLFNKTCVAYPVRPAACIGWHSYDARLCEMYVKGDKDMRIKQCHEIREGTYLVAHATAEVLTKYGFAASGEVDLVKALTLVLETPDAAQQWVAGHRLFPPILNESDGF